MFILFSLCHNLIEAFGFPKKMVFQPITNESEHKKILLPFPDTIIHITQLTACIAYLRLVTDCALWPKIAEDNFYSQAKPASRVLRPGYLGHV